MKIYPSKIDTWLILVVFVPLITPLIISIMGKQWEVVVIMLAITAGIIWLFRTTRYIIDGNVLHVKGGFLVNKKIKISDIVSVSKTNNPLSAPALSLKRLEIKYGKNYDYALVSPLNREDFVEELLAVNPNIQVKL